MLQANNFVAFSHYNFFFFYWLIKIKFGLSLSRIFLMAF